MELQLDISKSYAIALEGGGAKGAYEIGVWKAFAEAGVQYHAVAGTSVGALNGALMVMEKLDQAVALWENIRFSQVFEADDTQMKKLYDKELEGLDVIGLVKKLIETVKDGGLDIEPLRQLIAEQVDEEKIRTSSKQFFLTTYSLTDKKELDIDAKALEDGKLQDMLLASAYVPLFRREKMDGIDYVDGSVYNILPISCLLDRGYRDIIAVRIYGLGFEKKIRIPEDANIITVAPKEKLGGILQFDAEQSRKDMQLGYFDGKRMLYGLAGEMYYIDRQWEEQTAYFALKTLIEQFYEEKVLTLREMNEKFIPKLAKKWKAKEESYHALLLCLLEQNAAWLELDPFVIRTEEEFLQEILHVCAEQKEKIKFF